MRRFISFLVALSLTFSLIQAISIPATATATAPGGIIHVGEVYSMPGSKVAVDIVLKNNPGILSMTLTVTYDASKATLSAVKNGKVLSHAQFAEPKDLSSGCTLPWAAQEVNEEDIVDGVIATLTFDVAEKASVNDSIDIVITYKPGAIIDNNLNPLDEIEIINGSIGVLNYTPGDVNEDGFINANDVTYLLRYTAGGYLVNGAPLSINEAAADVNNDGNINASDATYILRYTAGGYADPIRDGFNLILRPSSPKCNHTMQEVKAKDPTCTEDGIKAFYYCTTCNKCYSDSNGATEITAASTVIPSTGHKEVTVPGKEPTYSEPGYTESKKCSVCGKVFIAAVELPQLEKNTVNIVYHLEGREQDQYLIEHLDGKDLSAINTNPTEFDTTKQEHTLRGIGSVIPGYVFKGWVDEYGDPFRTIKKGQTGSIEIYATWDKLEYKIIFDSPDVDIPEGQKTTYTIDERTPLKALEKYGYTFTGWSTNDGFLITEIEPGTVGPVELHANWTANRNIATSYRDYGDPIIIEDANNGQILFVYNIGMIDNVPLNEIPGSYFHNMDVHTFNESLSISNAVDSGMVNGINKMISNATTRSSGWTLTSEWNDIYTNTETVGTLKEKSDERTTSQGTVVGGKYFISNSDGGSTYVSNESGGSTFNSSKVTTDESMGINGSYDKSKEKYCDVQLGVKTHLGGSAGVGAEAGVATPIPIGVATAGVNGSVSVDASVDGEAGIQNGRKDKSAFHIDGSYSKYTGTVDYEEDSNYYNSTISNESNWNSTAGYEQSWQSSCENSVTQAIKEQISRTSEHSVSKAVGGGESTTESKQDTFTNAEEYNTTFTYGTTDTTSTTKTVTETFTVPGHYRYITAGTIHVYGVVGYDIATASYYTYCFNVLDDKTRQIWDYSKDDKNFEDCNNGVVTFDIPFEINDYVAGMVGKTNGLEISYDGKVTDFEPTEDFDGTVVIPQYERKNNHDGTESAVKVTSFDSEMLAKVKDEVKIVILPTYITEIPNNAFEGFTKLETVIAYGVTKIGKEAFKGCTSLDKFYVDTSITHMGENAFQGVEEIFVAANNANVAMAAINSGAKRITLNIGYMTDSFDNRKIVIGSDGNEANGIEAAPDYFALISNGKTYNNLQVMSSAEETMISNITFANNVATPISLDSGKVLLARVTVADSPAFAVIMKKDAEVQLLGDISLNTSSGNAVLSRNVTFSKATQNTTSYIYMNGGKYLVCGEVTNKSFIKDDIDHKRNVEPTVISEEEFKRYFESCTVTFDPNGGIVDTTSKTVYFEKAYGELPVPIMDYHNFLGWYTKAKAEEGDLVTEETVFSAASDITLYAHWELKPLSDWTKASEIPSDAQTVEQKWTYTKTTTTESRETSLAGYNQIGSRWVESGRGSVNYSTEFHPGFDTNHWIYTSFNKAPLTGYEDATSKRTVVSNNWAGYVYWGWMYSGTGYANTTKRMTSPYYGRWDAYGNKGKGENFIYFSAFTSTVDCPYLDKLYCCSQNLAGYNCHNILPTKTNVTNPRHFRFNYYTSNYVDYYKLFTYQKVENLESATEVSASDTISNVQGWVRYREK